MNRISKIFLLALLLLTLGKMEWGCGGLGTGPSPLGGPFNGATPEGTPGGEIRPSGQPTEPAIPGPPPSEFYMALKVRSADESLFSQCGQFTAKMWQDPKEYGVLYALNKQIDPTTTDGGFDEPVCKPNGIVDSAEKKAIQDGTLDCDDLSGCCNSNCKWKDIKSECQNQVIHQGGLCTKDHNCVIWPLIKITVTTENPDKTYSYDIPLCPIGPKVVGVSYDINWDAAHDPNNPLHFRECTTKVSVVAELINPSNGAVYKSPLLSGICPSPTQGGECKVDMTLSQNPQPDGEIHCKYTPTKDLGAFIDVGGAKMKEER